MTDTITSAPEWRPVEVHAVIPPVTRLAGTPVGAEVQKLHDIALRAYEASARHRRLTAESTLSNARTADAKAHGAAIAAGQPDPGDVNVEKLVADVRAAHRQASGLSEAANIAQEEVGAAVIGDAGDAWGVELDTRRAGSIARIVRVLNELKECEHVLQAVLDEDAWRRQAVGHLNGDTHSRSSAQVAWPQSFGILPPKVLLTANRWTIAEIVEFMSGAFTSGAALPRVPHI